MLPLQRRSAFVLPVASLLAPRAASAAPRAEPWPFWETHDDASSAVVDHGSWDRFLRARVRTGTDGINRLPYGAVGAEERAALEADIARLAAVPVRSLNRREQRAYWINFYNALTVVTVLRHYPLRSIRDIDISPGLFASGPWGRPLATVEGQALTLDDIEHRILRPIWRDPRTHYAVNCASLGCPNLPPRAFTAATLDGMLNAGARDYVNHPRGAEIADGRLIVSSIYDWFQSDFGGNPAGVIAHLRQYAAPPLAAALAGITRIGGDRYDWALNDARGP